MGRYTRHLTSWLRQQARSFDVIMSDAIREESACVVDAVRSTTCASVLRLSGWGDSADPIWWNISRLGRRYASIGKQADAVVAKSGACNRSLVIAGYSTARVHRIETGFSAGPARSAAARARARQVLAQVNSDLRITGDCPVLLCTAPMNREGGIGLLVRAARHLVAAVPDLRIWFVGDGPYRDWIYEELRGDGLRASIAMPGSFCNLEDLMAAADVFVQTDDSGLDHFLPTAVSAELPVVAIDSESTRAILGAQTVNLARLVDGDPQREPSDGDQKLDPDQCVTWVADPTAVGLRKSILSTLDDPAAGHKAATLRRQLIRARPQTGMIDAYASLFGNLATMKFDADQNPPAEAIS